LKFTSTHEKADRNEYGQPPEEEVLVDRPEADNKITRVTGPFCVEGTIPTPVPLGEQESEIQDLKFEI
jgi:hypothetical protein